MPFFKIVLYKRNARAPVRFPRPPGVIGTDSEDHEKVGVGLALAPKRVVGADNIINIALFVRRRVVASKFFTDNIIIPKIDPPISFDASRGDEMRRFPF